MSYPQYGRDMDRPSHAEGSVRRAREMAQARQRNPEKRTERPQRPQRPPPPISFDEFAGSPLSPPPRRHMPPSQPPSHPPGQPPPPVPTSAPPRPLRPRAPPGFEGKGGHLISRPTQAPHWPLPPGSPLTPQRNDQQHLPVPGRPQQAPPRPARPSRIPSIVNQDRPQQPTPIFFTPQEEPEHKETAHDYPLTPATDSSRLTTSSVGTIPEFPTPGGYAAAASVPAPGPAPPTPTRKSATIGPPPTSRRGASSFYSAHSYVEPIPEESPRSRAHGSYASSAAMPKAIPESWDAGSPTSNHTFNTDAFYDDSMTEQSRDSMFDDYGDESKLVRSASIGKKAKAALVDAKSAPTSQIEARNEARPDPVPVQSGFDGATRYVEASTSSSNTLPSFQPTPVATPDGRTKSNQLGAGITMMNITEESSGGEAIQSETIPAPKPSRRLSAMKRPPRLDIDAVRAAEARGSITSLPDLIKRATRLASMIEKGNRPASKLDNLTDFLNDKAGVIGTTDGSSNDRHQSGLSDMIAAFPPPGHPNARGEQVRGSWFRTTSWPFPPNKRGEMAAPGPGPGPDSQVMSDAPKEVEETKRKRRCCGIPLWVFIILVIIVLCIIVAAILVPLQFFVFKNWGSSGPSASTSEITQCKVDLVCKNGGTNVLSQGACSCICTNGFTGSDCGVEGSEGCTTTNLVSSDGSSTINNVTLGMAIPRLIADARGNFSVPLSGTTILAKVNSGELSCREQNSLVTFDGSSSRPGGTVNTSIVDDEEMDKSVEMRALPPSPAITAAPVLAMASGLPSLEKRTTSEEEPSSLLVDISTTTDTASPQATKSPLTKEAGDNSPEFNVTQEVLDFARVAVLYVLQEQSFDDAETAQNDLQRFFSDSGKGITERQAYNLTIGGSNTVNLVGYRLDLGEGVVGKSLTKRRAHSMRHLQK